MFKYIPDNHGFWLAASDIGQNPGSFKWTDRTPVDGFLWMTDYDFSQYRNAFGSGKTTCVGIDTRTGKLFNRSCTDNANTMCEVPAVHTM